MHFLRIDPMDSCIDEMLTQAGHSVRYAEPNTESEFLAEMKGVEGLILRSRMELHGALLEKIQGLKIIGRAGAGLENIDLDTANRLGITVLNSPEGNRECVGEHSVALLLSLVKKLYPAYQAIQSGRWDRKAYSGTSIMGKTIGIIGLGNMGEAFSRKLMGFSVDIIAYDPYRKVPFPKGISSVSLETLRAQSDVVSFHTPLNSETTHYFNEAFLEAMAKPFYLLNTSRGNVVKNSALIAGLRSGKILGAGLDVIEGESSRYELRPEEEFIQALYSFPNVIISPHVAGVTERSLIEIARELGKKLLQTVPTIP
jgi:D-3-phosphoglycerate dehydrogenase